MTIAGTINLNGVDEMLRKLPQAIGERKVVVKALKKGAAVLREAAHDNLIAHGSVDTGLLSGTLVVAERGETLPGVHEVVVKASGKLSMVVRKGRHKESRARPSKYAHFVEYGTEHSPAEPFMRPALDTKGAAAVEVIRAEIQSGVAAVARAVGLKVS